MAQTIAEDALCWQTMKPESSPRAKTGRWGGRRWLLLLPYLGLCFPQIYARNTPVLLGFPFFYWYQLVWVLLASVLIGLVYLAIRE